MWAIRQNYPQKNNSQVYRYNGPTPWYSMIVLHQGSSPEHLLLGCGCCGAASFQGTCGYYSIVDGLIFIPQGLLSLTYLACWSALHDGLGNRVNDPVSWSLPILAFCPKHKPETIKLHYGEGLSFVGYWTRDSLLFRWVLWNYVNPAQWYYYIVYYCNYCVDIKRV